VRWRRLAVRPCAALLGLPRARSTILP
jgi:hypothetical protein